MKVINVGLSILISMGLAVSPVHANDIDIDNQTEVNSNDEVNDNVTSDNGETMDNNTSSLESKDVAAASENEVVSYKVSTRDGNTSYEVDENGTKKIQLKVVKVYADGHEEETTDYTYKMNRPFSGLTAYNANGNLYPEEEHLGIYNEITVKCDTFEEVFLDLSVIVDENYKYLEVSFVNNHIATINVTYNAGEGSFSDGQKTHVIKIKQGERFWDENPQGPKGWYFDAWYDENNTPIWECDFSKDLTLYAKYVPIESIFYVGATDFRPSPYELDINETKKIKLQVTRPKENGDSEEVTDYTYKILEMSVDKLSVSNAKGNIVVNTEQTSANNELSVTKKDKGYAYIEIEVTVGGYTRIIRLEFLGLQNKAFTFDANGGSFSDGSTQKVCMTESGVAVYPETPQAPEGQVFDGWYKKDGSSINDDTDFLKEETFYAKYIQGINMTFDAGEGYFADNKKQDTILCAPGTYTWHESPTPPKGYMFVKWLDENGNEPWSESYSKDTLFHAVYAKIITVTLNSNGGTGNPIIEEAGAGTHYYLDGYREYFKHPDGKILVGFKNENTGNFYRMGYGFDLGSEPVTLSAVWADPITLTFDCNGGLSSKGEKFTEVVGKGYSLSYLSGIHETPTKDGLIFNGWHIGSVDGEKVDIYNSTFDKDTVLYASYAKPVKLTFDNSAAGLESKTVTIPAGEEFQTYSYNYIFMPESKEIIGYKIKGTNRIVKEYDWLTFDKDTELVLIVQDKLKVTYDSNGVGFDSKTEYVSKDTNYFSVYNVFEKAPEGKYFAGWALGSPDGPVIKTMNNKMPFSKDTTLFAVWKDGYKITLDLGSEADGYITNGPIYRKGYSLNLWDVKITESPKGKQLIGWRIDDNPKVINTYDTFIVNKDSTLHAVWDDAITISIRNPETGDVLFTRDITKGASLNDTSDISNYVPKNKSLKGWTLDNKTKEEINIYNTHFDKDTDLYPIYVDNIKVTLDWGNDGGSGYMYMNNTNTFECAQGQTYGFSFKILSSPKGKKLAGWQVGNTKNIIAVDSSTSKDGNALNGYVFNEDVTLHAVWKDNVKVTFDANGEMFGTGQEKIDLDLIKNQSYVFGLLPLNQTNANNTKTVTGWRLNSPNGPLLKKDFYYTFDTDVTYYAVWSDTIRINFEYQGVPLAEFNQDANLEYNIKNILQSPSAIVDFDDDVVFEGWFNKETGEKLTNDTKFTKDCVYEARTVKKSVTVTLDYNGGKGALKEVTPIGGYVYANMLSDPYFEAPKNKTFVGWSLKKDGEVISKGMYYSMYFDKDTTLYAIYADEITLTVHDGDKITTYKAPANTDLVFTFGSTYLVDGKTYYAGQHIKFTKDTEIYRMDQDLTTHVTVFCNNDYRQFGFSIGGVDNSPVNKWENNVILIPIKPGEKSLLELDDSFVPEGMVFDKWVSSKDVVFEDPTSKKTIFTIPETYLGTSINIYATYKEKSSLQFDKESVELVKGDRITLKVNGDYDKLTWSSSDPTTVQVDQNGNIHAVRSGQATISATDTSGNKITCVVKVTNKLKALSLKDKKLELSGKTEKKLDVTLNPEDADPENLHWSGDNESVVKVDGEGRITTVSCGEATITVKSDSGLKDTCTITVKHDYKLKSKTEATDEKEGKIVYECSLCKKTKEEVIPKVVGTWKNDTQGWWYQHQNGSYTKNDFETINGQTYYFDGNGYMVTGWKQIDKKWYYFNDSGYMVKKQWVGNYYFEEDGVMATNKWIGKYYVGADGMYQPAKWMQTNGKWWYRHQDGSYTKNDFETISGQTYYFDGNGYMVTGWKQINKKWYYFNDSGYMLKKQWVGNYYFEEDGVMATNKWIGNYYVGSDGMYRPAKWMQTNGKWWYRHQDESYTKNDFETISGQTYYFDGNGYMVTGWKQVGSTWYFFNSSGIMAKNKWVGDYYFDNSGAMVTNKWIGNCYVGADGKWIPNYKNGNPQLDRVD